MMARSPVWNSFWSSEKTHPSLFSVGFFPCFLLSVAWAVLTFVRRRIPSRRVHSSTPVLCVGNLTTGGTGKTPLVAALARHFSGRRPVVVSRGYRGQLEAGGGKVDLADGAGAAKFGDEPWMLAHQSHLPVYVGKDRAASVRRAQSEKPGLFLFDDGFQNRRVAYTKSVLVWDPSGAPENYYCFPLGRLREPFSAIGYADVVVSLSKGAPVAEGSAFPISAFSVPLICRSEGPFDAAGKLLTRAAGKAYGGFCGIGRPESFFSSLRREGWLSVEQGFPDHYWYTAADFERLNRIGVERELAGWITTEKDWYRLGEGRKRLKLPLHWLGLTVELNNDFLRLLGDFEELR